MNEKCRIVIADDHPIVRRELRQVIQTDASFPVVAEADDGEMALAHVESFRPRIAVLDIDMPRLDGLAVAREIGRRRLPVEILFLTIHADEDCLNAALDLGARGYILKESAVSEVVQALQAIAAGQFYVSASLTNHLLDRLNRVQPLAGRCAGLNDLTKTERRAAGDCARKVEQRDL